MANRGRAGRHRGISSAFLTSTGSASTPRSRRWRNAAPSSPGRSASTPSTSPAARPTDSGPRRPEGRGSVAGHPCRTRTVEPGPLFRRWQRNGTWHRILTRPQSLADAKGAIVWDLSVDSTMGRAPQHAAGAASRATCRRNHRAASSPSPVIMGWGRPCWYVARGRQGAPRVCLFDKRRPLPSRCGHRVPGPVPDRLSPRECLVLLDQVKARMLQPGRQELHVTDVPKPPPTVSGLVRDLRDPAREGGNQCSRPVQKRPSARAITWGGPAQRAVEVDQRVERSASASAR